MLSDDPERRIDSDTRLATRPTAATISIGVDDTSGGLEKRPIDSYSTQAATPNSSTVLARAAITSRRYRPKVRPEWAAARRTAMIADSAMAMPSASVAMCAASDSRARELVSRPPTSSASMIDPVMARPSHSLPRCLSPRLAAP